MRGSIVDVLSRKCITWTSQTVQIALGMFDGKFHELLSNIRKPGFVDGLKVRFQIGPDDCLKPMNLRPISNTADEGGELPAVPFPAAAVDIAYTITTPS